MDEAAAPCTGKISGRVHVFPLRVYYEDTDAAGIVYYANYLKFAERARTEMMHLLDGGYKDLIAERKLAFAVRHCEVDFLAPARLDDVLEVRSSVMETGGASVTARQIIRRGHAELTRLNVRLACVDGRGRAMRIPARIRAALETVMPD
jgi:acyl-CoA thioester hydrolase